MEGFMCSESGCSCRDFLPFQCSLCDNMYCLEHRSRFSHTCSGLSAETERKNNKSPQPSVREIMINVDSRFANQKASSSREHLPIKTSTDSTPAIDQTFARKLSALDNVAEKTANSKQRKISLKAKEMLIKTKATGNDSLPGKDRLYLSVHFTDSLDSDSDPEHKVTYYFFSQHKLLGEVMQHIWQLHYNTVQQMSSFQQNPALTSARAEDLTLVLTTSDTPNWYQWDRNTPIKDCLTNFEDVAVFAVPVVDVLANQDELAYVRMHGPRVVTKMESEEAEEEEEEDLTPIVPVKYVKEQLAWYHKVDPKVCRKLSIEQMEKTQPMIMVTISGVHLDDFPNVYYSVKLKVPHQFTGVAGCEALTFHTEKQTDHTHLLPVSEAGRKFGNTGPSAAGIAAAERSERANAAKYAAQQLQQTLCTVGQPVSIKVGFSNRDYEMKIGSLCTVAQLKLLISAITDVPVPDMKLICKGNVLKVNTQVIKDSNIKNGSKIVVMSSASHVV